MVNMCHMMCVVQDCADGTAKQNVTLHKFPKDQVQDAAYCSVSSRRREATGSQRVTPMCAVSTSFLLTSLTIMASQRNESSARLLSQSFSHKDCLIPNAQSVDSEATAQLPRCLGCLQ